MTAPPRRGVRKLATVVVLGLTAAAGGVLYAKYGRSADYYVSRGDRLVAEKSYAAAIVEYRNAVGREERRGDIRRKLARAYELNRDLGNALREYSRAADLMPDDAQAQLDAARLLLLAQRYEDARARAEAVLRRDPRNVDAFIMRGNATAGMRDLESALADLQDAVELAPQKSDAYINLGGLQLASGKAAEAEASFKQAVAVAPRSVTAHLGLATYYRHVGRPADAEQSLKAALQVDPGHPLVNRALVSLYLETGRAEEAEAPLKALVERTRSPQSKLNLADYYAARDRNEDALRVLTELAAHPEAAAAATSRIAGLEYKQGRRDRAHALIDEALAKDPQNAQMLVVKGGWLLGEGRIDEAFARARAAVEADGAFAPGHALMGAVHARRGSFEEAIDQYRKVLELASRDVGAQIEMARLNLRVRRPSVALPFAQEAVARQPTNGAARAVLAATLLALGEIDRGAEEARLLVEGAPSRAEGHALMGEVYLRRNDRASARRSFERALELDPDSVQALEGLVRLDLAARQVDAARRRIDSRLARTPDDPQILFLAARTHVAAGNDDQAEALFRRLLDVEPSFMEVYNALGQLYVRQGKLESAQREYESLAARQPRSVGAHTMVAVLLQVQGRAEDAKKKYEQVLAIDRRAVVAGNNLAYMHAEAGTNLDVALNLAQAAKAEAPDDADVDDTLGWVYYKRNLANLAIGPLERSVQRDPRNALYRYHLGLAYLKSGDKVRARAELDRALTLGLEASQAAEARQALALAQG
jgi:tetratricopeptide (TPR) repeat protein